MKNMYVCGAEPVVVVVDPGHGGENLGAQYEGYTEKEMTLTVALAMKEELEKYEGVRVYLTREGDEDLSLEARAEFAASVDADFLFCLHFNSSLDHELFGSEVWISAFGEGYQKGYAFASGEMELLEGLGLYPRGIKTRLNEDGEDYYGIIRHATERQVPSALIEHCHLDQEEDEDFYTSEEELRQLGILDATAAARYFGLRSDVLGVDYGGYRKEEVPLPKGAVRPDLTEPDVCTIDVERVDEETGEAAVSIYAADYDSYLLYYSYSWDGGESFSPLQRWEPRDKDLLTFTMKIPSGTIPDVMVRVYNKYDRITESNHVFLPSLVYGEDAESGEENEAAVLEAGVMSAKNSLDDPNGQYEQDMQGPRMENGNGKAQDGQPANDGAAKAQGGRPSAGERKPSILYFLQVAFLCTAILFVLILLVSILLKDYRSKKKRRRRK